MFNLDFFNYDVYMVAHSHVVTRCFGFYSEMMLVPLADCVNHYVTDSTYDMFNRRLDQQKEETDEKRQYNTGTRKVCNFRKNWLEDDESETEVTQLSDKSLKYANKVKLRQEIEKVNVEQFCQDQEFDDIDIWDLDYVSTSDEENQYYSRGGKDSESDEDMDELSRDDLA